MITKCLHYACVAVLARYVERCITSKEGDLLNEMSWEKVGTVWTNRVRTVFEELVNDCSVAILATN